MPEFVVPTYGGCKTIGKQGLKGCVGCPHLLRSSCTGGHALRQELFSVSRRWGSVAERSGRISPPLLGLSETRQLARVSHLLGPAVDDFYADCVDYPNRIRAVRERILQEKRQEEWKVKYGDALTEQVKHRLRVLMGERISIHGHSSNVFVGITRGQDRDYNTLSSIYRICSANSCTFRKHSSPWLTSIPGWLLSAVVMSEPGAEAYASIRFRRGARLPSSFKLQKCRDWLVKSGQVVVV